MLCHPCPWWRVFVLFWTACSATIGLADDGPRIEVPLVPDHLRQLLQDRDWPAALAAVEGELQRDGAPADRLLFLRGRILTYQEQYDAAVAAWRQVEQQFPDSVWSRRARFAAGMALAKQGDFEGAGQIYRAEADALLAPDRSARLADIYLKYADAAFRPEDENTSPNYAEALTCYEKALDAGPRPERRRDVELLVARCYQLLNQPAKAAERYELFVRSHPDAPPAIEARFRLGECHLVSGNVQPARIIWQDLLADHGDAPSPWIAEASFQLSRTWGVPSPGTEEQLLLGVAALRVFLERFPTHARVGEAYLNIAESYLFRERFADAARQLEDLLADERHAALAEIPRARQRLGYALLRQGRLGEAVHAWQKFLAHHPSDAAWSEVQRQVIDAEYLIAAHEVEARQFDTARQLLHDFLAKYPLDQRGPEILFLIGQLSCEEQQWEDAIGQWRQVVSKFPETEEASYAQYRIAEVLEQKLDKVREALQEYEKVTWGSSRGKARDALARMMAPAMTVRTPRVFRTDENPRLELTTRNIRSVTVRVYQLNMESYFRKVCLAGDVERLDIGLIDPDTSFVFEIPEYEDFQEFVSAPEILLPAGVDRGAMAVTVSSETLEATLLVLQSNLEIVVKGGRDDVFVFAENMLTGESWPGVKLLISDGRRVFAETVTGDDGVCHASYAELRSTSDVRVLALCDGHVASNVVGLEGISVTPAVADKGYLYTDRPMYYAGQDVHVRGCIRQAVANALAVDMGRHYELEVQDPRERPIWQQPAVLSEFGTFETVFPLPATSPPGTYRVRVRDGSGQAYEGSFQVDEYTREPVRVTVDVPRRVYYCGEDVTGTIRATDESGAALADQPIRYQWVNDREYTAQMNGQGEVPFVLSTRNFHADQVLTLSVKLPACNVEKMYSFYLAVTGYSVEVTTVRDVFVAGEEFTVTMATEDAAGSPVGQGLNLEVRKLTKVGNTLREDYVEDHVAMTDDVEGVARVTLQFAEGGRYRLRALGEDRWGNTVLGQCDVWISGDEDHARLHILPDRSTWHVGDHAEVTLHWREKPALALVTFQADRVWDYRLLRLETGFNRLPIEIDARWVPQCEVHAAVMVDVRAAFPDVTPGDSSAVSGLPLRFHTASRALNVTQELKVALSYPRQEGVQERVQPGRPLEVTIRTSDPQGRPVAAEVSLALIEQAALDRASVPPLEPIQVFFRPDQRPLAIRTSSSMEFAYRPATTPVDQAFTAERERIALDRQRAVDGPATIPDPSPGQQPSEAAGQTRGPGPGVGYPGMPGTAGGHFGSGRSESGADESTGSQVVALPRAFWNRDASRYPGMPIPERGTWNFAVPFAGDELRDEVTDYHAGAGGGVAQVPNETAYWNAAVVTGKDGMATVSIDVPRRRTAWVLTAKGITHGTLAGETAETFVSDQDLYGQLKLPLACTQGDETEVVAVVHNNLVSDGKMDVSLAVNMAGRVTETTRSVDVVSKGIMEVPFRVVFDPTHEATQPRVESTPLATRVTFRLHVAASGREDVVERAVPLTPRGLTTIVATGGVAETSTSATIDVPAAAQRESLRMRITVGPNVEQSLWDAVMLSPRVYGCDAPHVTADTETLSSDLMAACGLQPVHDFPATPEDPRPRWLETRIRIVIAALTSAQNGDGGWGWTLGSRASDRYTSARAVWSLSLARRAGYRVPDDSYQKATRYLTSQLAGTASSDHESKAILLHALCVAGQPDFSLGNRLHRERLLLSTPALLYLALAFVEMDRPPIAAELLSMFEQRRADGAAEPAPGFAAQLACNHSVVDGLALHALAVDAITPDAPQLRALIDRLLGQRHGARWLPERATGTAALALCRWAGRQSDVGDRYALAVSVNGRQAKTWDVDATASTEVLEIPAEHLVEGTQRIDFQLAGQARFVYHVALVGVVAPDQLQSTTRSWRVERICMPARRELGGQPIPRGFGNVRDATQAFTNPLSQLPRGQRGDVEIKVIRDVPETVPTEMLEYLVVTDRIPSGALVLTESIRGLYERVDIQPGTITFYLGNRRDVGTISYQLYGYLAGDFQIGPTIVRDAYCFDQFAVAAPHRLEVLPRGVASVDAYRLTPQELFEWGKMSYVQRDWPRAEALLTQLLTEWSLQAEPYRNTVEMLLDVSLELNKPDQIVRYFEIVFEQWPDKEIVLDKVIQIGAAYQSMGEAERSFQVFRAAVEGAFTREGGVAGVLDSLGKKLPSVEVMQRLLREYPPEPYIATAHYALAQQLSAWAPEAVHDPELRASGLARGDLMTAAWRMLEDFLSEYPLAPSADQAAFAAANALLESKQYAQAATASQRYGDRYADSDLLDDFWFINGYSRFALGEPDEAIAVLQKVATTKFVDQATGQAADSDNKEPAIYVLGQIYHSLGRVIEALQEYRSVEDRFPDAKAAIENFVREAMRLPELTTVRPGQEVNLALAYRNVVVGDLKVYRIDLTKFAVLRRSLAGIRDINLAGIEPYHEATIALGEGHDYRDVHRTLTLDLPEDGAYLVVCRGGSQFASGLVLVTPLDVEVQRDVRTGEVRATVRDVINDQYVHDAHVKVFGSGNAEIVAGETDRRGLFVAQGIIGNPTVIARAGSGRYAFHRSTEAIVAPAVRGLSVLAPREQVADAGGSLVAAEHLAGHGGTTTGVIVAGPGVSQEEQRIEALLDTPVTLTFMDTPLRDVAQVISDECRLTVRVDRHALDDVGLSGDTAITFEGRDLSLRSAMKLMLEELELVCLVTHDSLVITTPEEAENQLTTVAYPVTDLVRFRDEKGVPWSDYDTLIEMITSTVAPDAWDEVGGAGAIEAMPVQDVDVLMISQTQDVHRHIASILHTLRIMTRKETPDGERPVRERPEFPRLDGPMGMGGMGGGMGGMGGGMGGMGGGMGGMGGGGDTGIIRVPSNAWGARDAPGLAGALREPAMPGGTELLRGLEETKRRLQGDQVDELQRLYEQGKRGMGGGVGAGGFF